MNALFFTSITNFILACEAFFLTGMLFARPKSRFSAAWFWQAALLALSVSALIGGIDHGFFEVSGQTPVRKVIEHGNWFILGLLTLLAFLTTAKQFLNGRTRRAAYVLAAVQLAVFTGLDLTVDSFLIVIANYVPVMLLLLVLSAIGLKSAKGSPAMIAGIALAFIASIVQTLGVDIFSPFNRDSLYHTGMFIALIFMYLGGTKLNHSAAESGVQKQ
jgi:hypothetical protein